MIENSAVLCEAVKKRGWRIVSGGTDNHLFLVDLGADFISGKKAERWLGLADITVNKNTVPFDTRKPYIASGLRIGTPAVTTRGMGPAEMEKIAELIDRVLRADEDKEDEAKMAAFTAEMEAVKSRGPRADRQVPVVLRPGRQRDARAASTTQVPLFALFALEAFLP